MEESLRAERRARDRKWPESIAVGSNGFVAMVKKRLGMKAKGRKIIKAADGSQLRETQSPYDAVSGDENGPLGSHNVPSWKVYPLEPDT